MAEQLVVNTGPLIALQRANALDVVGQLPFEFLSPTEVQQELLEGVRHGHEPVSPPWVRFASLSRPLDLVARVNLGAGEAAVIELALQEGIRRVVIDERRGRRAALAVGLQVTGTLGLLGRAKALGLVPAVRPFVEVLRVSGWYDPAVIDGFLSAMATIGSASRVSTRRAGR